MERIHKIQKIQKMHTNVEMCIGGGMVWQVGGHGAELMINIALASMHVILYIDILGPTFVMRGGGHGPPAPPPPVLPPMMCIGINILGLWQPS